MLTILLFIDRSKMARIRINTRTHTKEKPYLINSYFFFQNWYGKKKKKKKKKKKTDKVSKIRVCMWVRYAEGIFVTFRCWLKNVKSRSRIALFSNERHFEIWFPKREQLCFSEVNYINYTKETQFCMWQLYFP